MRLGLVAVPGHTLARLHAHTHLDKVQHCTKSRALAPAVSFGAVLVAVSGQSTQGTVEGIHVLVNQVLLQRE